MDRKQMNFGNWKGSAGKEANYFMPFTLCPFTSYLYFQTLFKAKRNLIIFFLS